MSVFEEACIWALAAFIMAVAADSLWIRAWKNRPGETPFSAGSIGIAAGCCLTWALSVYISGHGAELSVIIIPAGVVAATKWLQERAVVSARIFTLVQLVCAVFIVCTCGPVHRFPFFSGPETGPYGYALALGWMLGVPAIFRLMDEMPGYAGVLFLTIGFGVVLFSLNTYAGTCFAAPIIANYFPGILAGACLGALISCHRVFHGYADLANASFLGFVVAGVPLLYDPESFMANQGSSIPAIGAIIFIPMLDATYTLLRQVARNEEMFAPERRHIYERLILSGFSSLKAALLMSGAQTLITVDYFYPLPVPYFGAFGLGFILFAGMVRYTVYREGKRSPHLHTS